MDFHLYSRFRTIRFLLHSVDWIVLLALNFNRFLYFIIIIIIVVVISVSMRLMWIVSNALHPSIHPQNKLSMSDKKRPQRERKLHSYLSNVFKCSRRMHQRQHFTKNTKFHFDSNVNTSVHFLRSNAYTFEYVCATEIYCF